jgi:hypothetical protein
MTTVYSLKVESNPTSAVFAVAVVCGTECLQRPLCAPDHISII